MLIDTATYALMQSIQIPILTVISKSISSVLDPKVLIIVSLILAAYFYIKFSKKQGVFFASVIFLTGILIELTKEIFRRVRPLNSIIPEHGFSMPSGHATIAVVFFGLLVFLFSRKKSKTMKSITTSIATLIILSTAFSRVYLRVHWLTDVLVGLILGTVILISAILFYKNNRLFKIPT